MECSAKDDVNIVEVFKTFLSLSRIIPASGTSESTSGLKRRSSAYVSASSKGIHKKHTYKQYVKLINSTF